METSLKFEFFKFISGEQLLSEFEEFVYSFEDLETQIGTENYLKLVSYDFDEQNLDELMEFLLDSIVTIPEYLTWKIRQKLIDFINNPKKIKQLLDEFYYLASGAYNSQGEAVKGLRFLQNLGMNYFYWMDKGYLETNYGKKWQIEYEKNKNDFEFYHQQLKPIAVKILEAIENDDIKITGEGDYEITELLKIELESDEIFSLKHKNNKC